MVDRLKLQTAINRFSVFISENDGKNLKDAPFMVKWRLRFSSLGWLSVMTWKLKWTTYKTDRAFKKLSPEKRRQFVKIFEDILEDTEN